MSKAKDSAATAPAPKADAKPEGGVAGVVSKILHRKSNGFNVTSKVEQWYLDRSPRQALYAPTEKIPTIQVSSFPDLGRLTALRFIEWVQSNPEGVISLPTGKTPEYFIKWTQRLIANWNSPEIASLLSEIGIHTAKTPDLKGLRFVQIDEFYPIDPAQHNSFHYYVTKHYLRGFGLDPNRAMLMDPTAIGIPKGWDIDTVFPGGKVDLSLRHRQAKGALELMQQQVIASVDQFCSEYEGQIQEWGGLGFFLGGIGPDGHIGFNARGSHLYSPTRLTYTNYETEAAAAGDLGGIEVARNKPVITIGLGTITYNPEAVVLVFAAGDAKAPMVRDAMHHDKNVLYPATVLQGMKHARFYITNGAAIYLHERTIDEITKAEKLDEGRIEKSAIDRAVALNVRLEQLTDKDVGDDRILKATLEKTGKGLRETALWTRDRLLAKINKGLEIPENQTVLHTGPHHDDISLGYMPQVMHLVRRASNKNYYSVLTSGFTAVTNSFLASIFQDLLALLEKGEFRAEQDRGELELNNATGRAAEVYGFLDGIAQRDEATSRRWQARRMLVNLMSVYEDEDFDNIKQRLNENLNYLRTLYPGKKDVSLIQKVKGMQREFEEELIWGYVGSSPAEVFHLRLGFYTGDIFTETPTVDRDVVPTLDLLKKLQPTIVTLAFDPEGAGPDTHYKVLQVLHEALLRFRRDTGKSPQVWGYRNVWYKFHPAEADIFIPATLNTIAVMNHSFMHCFGSQKNASFPSFEYDGPFCHLAQKNWVNQYLTVRTCLGERFFIENESPRLRATRGLVFLRLMSLDEFSGNARLLAEAAQGSGGRK